MTPRLAVCLVTHGSAADLPGCLTAVLALETRPLEVVLVDSASPDDTVAVAEREAPRLAVAGVPFTRIPLVDNVGYAAGMNRAIAATTAPWVLLLNADARPAPDYAERLLARAARLAPRRIGAATGRLVRWVPPGAPAVLDACGMRLRPTWRHLDRGSGERDEGQFAEPEQVFGATGAASLFSREALEDTAIAPGVYFDPLFHSFREDAELAFRLAERDWAVIYDPAARAEHRRFNLPERRGAMPAFVNYHSLKNRYLLRAYHQTFSNLLWTAPWTVLRDVLAMGYVLLRERSSLAAYGWLLREWRVILSRRRVLQARRLPSGRLDRWFRRDGLPL